MKVYIGPYPKWYSVYSITNKWLELSHRKHYLEIKRKDYTKLDKLVVGALESLQPILNATINKLNQKRRVRIKLHDYDSWSAYETLALVIHPVLVQLRNSPISSAFVDAEDAPAHLAPPPGIDVHSAEWSMDENFQARWLWVLDEMIWAFEQLTREDDPEGQFYSGETDMKFVPVKRDGTECSEDDADYFASVKGPNHTFEVDYDGLAEYNKRINNGLRLFGKYFRNLWD